MVFIEEGLLSVLRQKSFPLHQRKDDSDFGDFPMVPLSPAEALTALQAWFQVMYTSSTRCCHISD